jgi:Fe-S-cluster containining protein
VKDSDTLGLTPRVSETSTRLLTEITALSDSFAALPTHEDSEAYRLLGEVLDARMPGFYRAYEDYVAAVLGAEGRTVTCAPGCSACCRHFVSSVEPFELAALHRHIRGREDYPDLLFSSHGHSVAYEKLLTKEGEGEEASDRALHRYFLRGRACPFLEKSGACGVYEFRPMSCRMFFSEGSPRFCEGKEIASPWNKNFQVELPQELEEALARCSRHLEGWGFPEELFPGVLAANARFGRYDAGDSETVSAPDPEPSGPSAPPA